MHITYDDFAITEVNTTCMMQQTRGLLMPGLVVIAAIQKEPCRDFLVLRVFLTENINPS